MRIGIDATPLPPQPVGAGNYIIQLIRALTQAQFDDQLVIFAQPYGPELINLPAKEMIEWHIVEEMSPGKRLVWEQTQFSGLIHRSRIDLLHSLHYTKPIRLPCASVVTFHDMTFFFYPQLHTQTKRWFFPVAMRISARQADGIITVSKSTRKDAIQLLGIDPGKIFATQLGVDPMFRVIEGEAALRDIAAKYGLPKKFMLYLGTIEPRKNLPTLIEAFNMLVEKGLQQKLVLAGKFGWMYEEVLTLVRDYGLKDHIIFPGYVEQDDLPMVYNLASLFVYPTIYEGFGLPVLEAMACGVPVVTSDIASLPEIVGEAGLLVLPGDVNALFEAILQVMNDEELRTNLRRAGIQRAKNFRWERTAELTQQVYMKVLNHH
jgi:glycosyltransferase involved in cell wall biosynthesis